MSESLLIRNSLGQTTKRNVAGTSENVSHAQWWEEDLDDILDILSHETSDTTHLSQASLSSDLLTFPTLPVQITSCPQITIQSDFPIFQVAHNLEPDHVPNANITDNISQPSDITSVQNLPCVMDGAVSGPETSSPEKSFGLKRFSRKNQRKLLLQYSEREETGNTSHIKKPTSSIRSPNKLFGILSLILQAFNNPLTEELEEYYAGALQRALAEIQSAAALYNSLSDKNSEEN